jgi:hypothetical protein
LREVWEWKDAIARQVRDMPLEEAVRAILRKAEAAAGKHAASAEAEVQPVAAVAEGRAEYRTKGK